MQQYINISEASQDGNNRNLSREVCRGQHGNKIISLYYQIEFNLNMKAYEYNSQQK